MTHNQRVLALLSDGKPHSYREGYRLGVMLHSRVADLRKAGHVIECDKSGGDFVYRLIGSAGVFGGAVDAAGAPPTTRSADSSSGSNAPAGTFPRPPVSATPTDYGEPPDRQGPLPHNAAPAGQLAFEVAA